jgi:hypothetical protein
MSTPVIDRQSNTIFLVSRVKLFSPERIVYRLHALDLLTGSDKAGSPLVIDDQVIFPVNARFNPSVHNQRPGLAIAGGNVVVAFGSHADVMPYRGWVLSFRYDGQAGPNGGAGFTRTGAFVSTPGGNMSRECAPLVPSDKQRGDAKYDEKANDCAHGGIWMAGRAPAIDSAGNLLFMIGNGKNDTIYGRRSNFGNSLVKLDPVSLHILDFFTPDNHIYLNDTDLDFGGSGPMLIPGTDFIVGGGKQGVLHVWSGADLGQFQLEDRGVRQKIDTGDRHGHNDRSVDHPGGPSVFSDNTGHPGHIMGGPVYWPRTRAQGGSRIYNWSEGAELRAYEVNTDLRDPISVPATSVGQEIQEGHPGGILALSADGGKQGTGIVWANTYDAGPFDIFLGKIPGALNAVRPGTLRAFDAATLEQLWTSDQRPNGPDGRRHPDALGLFAKFTPPTISNGRVYMATFSNQVVVYGLLNYPYGRLTQPAIAETVELMQMLLDDDDRRPTRPPIVELMQMLLDDDDRRPTRPLIVEQMHMLLNDDN